MNRELQQQVAAALGSEIDQVKGVSGGDINDAALATLADGRTVFIKTNPAAASLPGLFQAEAEGLAKLRAAAQTLHVPEVLAVGEGFLVMQAVDTAGSASGSAEMLGRGLAELHRATAQQRFGFDQPTYLGRWLQDNAWSEDWVGFWRDRRLLPWLEKLGDYPDVIELGQLLAERLDEKLAGAEDEPGVLIHGDLWAGNTCSDPEGRVWIYDPAAYYAKREAEFGMIRLFGNFGPRFESAYHAVWPLAEGAEDRIRIYTLHHLLSHLWHFGGGYHGQCVSMLRQLCG